MSEFLTDAGFGLLRRLGGSILANLSWGQIAVLAAGGLFVLYSLLGGATRLLRRPRFLAVAGAGVAVALLFTGWAAKPRIPGLLAADGPAHELATPGDEPVIASELVEPPAGSGLLADLASMGGVTPPPAIGLAPAGFGGFPSLLPTAIAPSVGVSHSPPPAAAPAASSTTNPAKPGGARPVAGTSKPAHAPTRVAPRGFNTATSRPRPANPSSAGLGGKQTAGLSNRQTLSSGAAAQSRAATNRATGLVRGNAGAYGPGRGYGSAGSFGIAPQHAPSRAPSQAALNRMASEQMDNYMRSAGQTYFGGGGMHPMGGMHPATGHPAAHHAGHR